ncbi:Probable transport protein YPL264C [Durusdinium trenchii]|uniref:Probable transport protein YPL264C n=1 Tax=Durusdinium trenchii TaxID=1381693 RepID=A0ABP0J7G3_9DINO
MIAGAFFFSLMALIVKLLNSFGTYELVFWRSVFMFAGTMSILAAKGINPLGPSGSRVLLWVRAAAGFGFMSGYYYAIQHLPLSDAVVITYTSPVITAVAAALLLGEAWGRLDALGSVLCMFGVVLISKPGFVMSLFGFPAESIPLNGLLGAIIAAVMSSAVYLLVRVLKGEKWSWHTERDWPLLVLLAVFSVAGQALMNLGLTLETAAKATAMNYSQVVFAFVFQTALLHEPTDSLSVAGSMLIAMWGVIALAKDAGSPRAAEEVVRNEATVPEMMLQRRRLKVFANCTGPELLTVELPQSLEKQDDEIQVLLKRCREEGATICPHKENDHLQLAEAAAKCNSRILNQVDRLVVFATNRSDKYLSLVKEAKDNNVMVAAFNVDL